MQQIVTRKEPELSSLIPEPDNDKIPALPLRFDSLPVQLLSKEFTKLNSTHQYRVHYLGSRPYHSLALHKKYGYSDEYQQNGEFQEGYPAPLRRIVNSNFMNEKLRDNNHYKSSFFYRAFEGMNPTLPNSQLVFNSAFESGNLDCAIKVGPYQYDLFLRIDSNSRGHTHWYFFSIKNLSFVNQPITLHICNLGKRLGLYDQGLRPYVKSTKAQQTKKEEWHQSGENIVLQASSLRYEFLNRQARNFYRLSFTYVFQYDNDQVFFAYCPPYTYSNIIRDIHSWQQHQQVKVSTLGRSLSGLSLPILHVTNHSCSPSLPKKNVVLTGRLHPAQCSGSYALKGFINWLLCGSSQSLELLGRTNFFIVPMVNPDGVVLGNSRTSAAGKDLNREFKTIRKDLYPQVYLIKRLIFKLQKRHKVLLFLDFHGHSRKKNTFFYGPNYPINHRQYYRCRAFPRLIERINPIFRFYSCSFCISENKKKTGRAIALNQLKVPYVYTVQSSIGLYYNPNSMKTHPFLIQNWLQIGFSIAQGLAQFVLGIQELEAISRDRKLQREKQKESKFKQKEFREQSTKQQKQKDNRESGDNKDKKRFLLFEAIEDVKVAISKPNFEEDQESDDHDSNQDLEPYQLLQFNNLVIADRSQHRKKVRNVKSEQEQEFVIGQYEEQEKEKDNQDQLQVESPRMPPRASKSVQPRREWIKPVQEITRKIRSSTKEEIKITLKPKQEPVNFIKQNKMRYSATNIKILGNDKREIITLPKNIVPTRLRESSKQSSESVSRKKISSLIDKLCLGRGSEWGETYKGLSCLELDNRAMTITTFRKK